MEVKRLDLTNFRGTGRLELEFRPGINVIAGKNGVGKSGVLSSMAVLLSQIAYETKHISARSRQNFNISDIRHHADFLQCDLICEAENVPFRARLTKNLEQIAVQQDDGRKPYSSEDRSHHEVILRDEPQFAILPNNYAFEWGDLSAIAENKEPFLAIYYATNRSYFRQLRSSSSRAKLDAYDGALSGDFIDLNEFAAWVGFISDVAPSEYSNEIGQHFQEAIARFLPGFANLRCIRQEIERDGKTGIRLLLSIEKDGEEFELQQLSDGERGVLAIVLDLARRLSLSHRRSADPLSEGQAVVLIDEIDLHLHPAWQREILSRLETTFPRCQFILTTHSPQVISETKSENLIYLKRSAEDIEREMIGESYGRDVNYVVSEIMDTPIRNLNTQKALNRIFDLIQQAEFEQAHEEIEALREVIGDEPELDRAEIRIERLEMDEE